MLKTREKKNILINNIFGVDIDSQAAEVTKLSLLLKVLENETRESLTQLNLFGEPLYQQLPNTEEIGKQNALYEAALREWESKPDDADAIIWLGRRTAYLGRIREAAAIFSHGIKVHPEDPRMYRHRGHRFISLRLFDQAIDDLDLLLKSLPLILRVVQL
jgi:tetratricopeptide (TPR) repeat protein